MPYPIEPALAESWTQPDDTTYIFKRRRGVRWHPKPPVNGRELTADDIKYTYERFLTITGNPNKAVLEYVDKIEALDKHTVKFTLRSPTPGSSTCWPRPRRGSSPGSAWRSSAI